MCKILQKSRNLFGRGVSLEVKRDGAALSRGAVEGDRKAALASGGEAAGTRGGVGGGGAF